MRQSPPRLVIGASYFGYPLSSRSICWIAAGNVIPGTSDSMPALFDNRMLIVPATAPARRQSYSDKASSDEEKGARFRYWLRPIFSPRVRVRPRKRLLTDIVRRHSRRRLCHT